MDTPQDDGQRRWWHWRPGMPRWALVEHVWWLRALMAAGFPIMAWGTYKTDASVVFAGIAATAVGLMFWRISGPTEFSVGVDKATPTTDVAPMRDETLPSVPTPPASLTLPAPSPSPPSPSREPEPEPAPRSQ